MKSTSFMKNIAKLSPLSCRVLVLLVLCLSFLAPYSAGVLYDNAKLKSWTRNGFTAEQALRWWDAGMKSYAEVVKWRAERFEPETAKPWFGRGIPYDEAAEWRDSGTSIEQALDWRAYAFAPEPAAQWMRHGFTRAEATAWRKHSFTPDEADAARSKGLTPAAAARELEVLQ